MIGTEAIRSGFDQTYMERALNSRSAPGVTDLVLKPDAHAGYAAPVGCVMVSVSSRRYGRPHSTGPERGPREAKKSRAVSSDLGEQVCIPVAPAASVMLSGFHPSGLCAVRIASTTGMMAMSQPCRSVLIGCVHFGDCEVVELIDDAEKEVLRNVKSAGLA